jgi:hypothetical protein
LIAFNNLPEGISAPAQALCHQFGIVVLRSVHRVGRHHIIMQVPQKRQEVTKTFVPFGIEAIASCPVKAQGSTDRDR